MFYDIGPVIISSLKSCAEDAFQHAIYWRWPVAFLGVETIPNFIFIYFCFSVY